MSLLMEIQEYINQKKDFHQIILEYVEDEGENDENFRILIKKLNNILDNENDGEILNILHLISKISDNHQQNQYFIIKIERILLHLSKKIKQTLSNFEIFNIFRSNKRILLFLIKNNLLLVDESIANDIANQPTFCHFFYPEIQSKVKVENHEFQNFERNRKIGENESYICTLIREDSVEEFVSYVSQTNLSLSNTLCPSR